jgi:hypothetical protein
MSRNKVQRGKLLIFALQDLQNRSNPILSFTMAISLIVSGCGTEFSSKKNKKNPDEIIKPIASGDVDPDNANNDHRENTDRDGKEDSGQGATDDQTPGLKLTGLEPYKYQAEVTWPKGIINAKVYLNKALTFKSSSNDLTGCYLFLESGKTYKIQIFGNNQNADKLTSVTSDSALGTSSSTLDSSNFSPTHLPIATLNSPEPEVPMLDEPILIREWVIETPYDVDLSLISSTFGFEFFKDIKADRVFIHHEIPVITQGYDVHIDADEFIVLKNKVPDLGSDMTSSEAASLSTLDKDKMNIYHGNGDGKDGGHIIIKAKKATGRLSVFLLGQKGIDGKNGDPYSNRAATGANGELADYRDCRSGGTGKTTCFCDRKTADRENGRPGAKGEPARNGTNGGRGGDSGSIRIEIAEPSPTFQVVTTSLAGVPGIPGKAGPPQLGGLGGQPVNKENPTIFYMCEEPHAGTEGPSGDSGFDGIRQRNGLLEQNCISIGEGFGRCSN